MSAVIDAYAQGKYLMVALAPRLYVSWGEFALAGDVFDNSLEGLVFIGVYLYGDLFVQLGVTHLRFRHIDAHPQAIQFNQRSNWRARIDQIAGPYSHRFDKGVGGCFDLQFAKLGINLLKRGAGAFQLRAGRVEVTQMWGRPESVRQEFRRIRSQ